MTHTSTELPEALRLAENLEQTWCMKHEAEVMRRLHARVHELEAIRKAACKAYNTWAYSDDIYGDVTKAMHALADAINGITQEKQG